METNFRFFRWVLDEYYSKERGNLKVQKRERLWTYNDMNIMYNFVVKAFSWHPWEKNKWPTIPLTKGRFIVCLIKHTQTTKSTMKKLTQKRSVASWWWVGRRNGSSCIRPRQLHFQSSSFWGWGFRVDNKLFEHSCGHKLGGSTTIHARRSRGQLFTTPRAITSDGGQTNNHVSISCRHFYQVLLKGIHIFMLKIFIEYL